MCAYVLRATFTDEQMKHQSSPILVFVSVFFVDLSLDTVEVQFVSSLYYMTRI